MTDSGTLTTEALEAARAYLARTEARLSTLHRIAGVFLNGAGLLALFSVFFKDAVLEVATQIIHISPVFVAPTVASSWWGVCFALPVIVSLGLLLYSFYVLLRDLVAFYFVPEHFGLKSGSFYPRFVLEALAFPTNEASDLKRFVIARLRKAQGLRRFVLPYHQDDRDYFSTVRVNIGREAILGSRAALTAAPPAPESVDERTDREDFELFNVAFGMAGGTDRDVLDDVATMESSLVRHSLNLRRLVLRYMKALIMVVTTVVATLVVQAILRRKGITATGWLAHWEFLVALTYAGWAVATVLLVRSPLRWIHRLGDQNLRLPWNPWKQPDKALAHFEQTMFVWCAVCLLMGVVLMIRYWPWQ